MNRSTVVSSLAAPALSALLTLASGALAAQGLPVQASAGRTSVTPVVAPLLADDGTAYTPAHHMAAAEAAAGGKAPGWATRAQAAQLQRAHPQRVLRLRVNGNTPKALPSLSPGAWVLVDGAERAGADAVRLARRLAEAGAERVWVVLPDERRADIGAAKADPRSAW